MCGIAGLFEITARSTGRCPPAETALRMVNTLAHRGPDGTDSWGEIGIGFGHRRLAIVDLSDSGRQPMTSADGRYVITYNGEVYNFKELRAELEALGHRFRGTSTPRSCWQPFSSGSECDPSFVACSHSRCSIGKPYAASCVTGWGQAAVLDSRRRRYYSDRCAR